MVKMVKEVIARIARLWKGMLRWRWWPTVMAWVAVTGAVLAAGPYRLWVPAVVKAGSVSGLRVMNNLLAAFPEMRWQLVAGGTLFLAGVGGCSIWTQHRYVWPGKFWAWYTGGAVFWTFGLSIRSLYDSYISGGPVAQFLRVLRPALKSADWGEPLVQLVRAMYNDILIPNLYTFRLSDWAGYGLKEHLRVPALLGAVVWLLFAFFILVFAIGDRDDWRLLWSTPLPPAVQAPPQASITQPAAQGPQPAQGQGGLLNVGQPSVQVPYLPVMVPLPEKARPDPHAFDELVGVGEAVEILKAQVSAWLRPREAAAFGVKPARGILFYGPPGTGKTSLARAAARYFGVHFVSVSTPELISHWIGASEAKVHELFEQARRAAPCIVFLDEIDAVGRRRDDRHLNRPSDLVLPVLLQELDGFRPLEGVLVIAATNRRDVLDEALLRRFTQQIHIGLPDAAGREELLRRHLKGLATELDFAQAAERLDGLSPADIEAICQRIRQRAWLDKTSGRRYRPVTLADLERELGGRRRWQDDVL